ncbi:MAG: 4Fe-4S binding protein [Bacteroidales bacterium]|nr:4Fe-4S binding protein [Bacteroidales bacterium]MCF8456104.1 4Fe-4S binding protein [Bacteroidales bacterium]
MHYLSQALITYSINVNCIGCTLCAQKCPVDAIAFTPHEKHIIDTEKCIKCDSCMQVCPEGAVVVEEVSNHEMQLCGIGGCGLNELINEIS